MNYSFLLTRSWEIVRRHRFIWWLGVLAMFTEGGGGGGGFNGRLPTNLPSESGRRHEKSSSGWSTSALAMPLSPRWGHGGRPRVDSGFFGGADPQQWLQRTWTRMLPFLPLVILGVVLLFLLWLVLIYFSFAAQAGLILSVQALEEHQLALGFARAMEAGQAYAWRLFGMGLLLGFGLLLLLAVLAAPVVALALLGHQSVVSLVSAVLVGVVFGLGWIALALYVSLLIRFAARRIVLANEGVMDALTGAHTLVRGQLGTAIVSWLVGIAVGLAYSIALVLALLLVGGVLAVIGVAFYALARWPGVIAYAIPVGMALLVLLFILNGAFTGFVSSYWTLVYRSFLGLTARTGRPGPWDRPVQWGKADGFR